MILLNLIGGFLFGWGISAIINKDYVGGIPVILIGVALLTVCYTC